LLVCSRTADIFIKNHPENNNAHGIRTWLNI
jgi:hypothetical protein